MNQGTTTLLFQHLEKIEIRHLKKGKTKQKDSHQLQAAVSPVSRIEGQIADLDTLKKGKKEIKRKQTAFL